MSIQGWYYLHVNGDLIFKHDLPGTAADIRESDFALGLWAFDSSDRESGWQILVEGLAGGARPKRIEELAAKWGCDDQDADMYAERVGLDFIRMGARWCATPRPYVGPPCPGGCGATKLEAFAELAKTLGYKPSKIWGETFHGLLQAHKKGARG